MSERETALNMDDWQGGQLLVTVDAPQPCPHCKLPPVLPETCTPELGAVIEQQLAERWGLLNTGVDIGQRLAGDAPQPCAWRDIATAPARPMGADPADVLLYGPSIGVKTGRAASYAKDYVFAGVSYINGNLADDGMVTHWMPLPSPPVLVPSGQE